MRYLALALILMITLIQNPLWFGKGGWLRVRELDRQVEAQKETNARLAVRNGALDAEVADLKQGYDAIEERARAELGMVRQDEVFYQLLQPARAPASYPSGKP
jgi:cell division protein FtsB